MPVPAIPSARRPVILILRQIPLYRKLNKKQRKALEETYLQLYPQHRYTPTWWRVVAFQTTIGWLLLLISIIVTGEYSPAKAAASLLGALSVTIYTKVDPNHFRDVLPELLEKARHHKAFQKRKKIYLHNPNAAPSKNY